MILSELFSQINATYRGTDDDAPVVSTTEWTMWLVTTNRKLNEWSTDDKNNWSSNFRITPPSEAGTVATTGTTTLTGTSTYFTDYNVGDTLIVSGETVRTIDTITSDTVLTVTVAFSNTASAKTFTRATIIKTGVQSYSLNRSLYLPSDYATVTLSTSISKYMIGKPQERDRFENEIYISGRNPQIVTFYDTVATNIIGGTFSMPGYYFPADFTAETDVVPVDDPYWLVYAVASELAFNDITYSDKAADLNAKANNLYSGMVSINRRGTSNYPRIARTNVTRIPGTRNETLNSSETN